MCNDKIRGCVFDLDGTLLDTLGDIMGAVNSVRARYTLPPETRDTFRRCIGNGQRFLLETSFGKKFSEGDYKIVLEQYISSYEKNLIVNTVPFDGIHELLVKMTEAGIKTAVLSNKRTPMVRELAEHFYSDIPFISVYGHTEGYPLKPAPDLALKIAGEMGLSPSEIAFTGDSWQDAETARNAGMKAFSVLWGYQTRDEILDKITPDAFFSSPELLADALIGNG